MFYGLVQNSLKLKRSFCFRPVSYVIGDIICAWVHTFRKAISETQLFANGRALGMMRKTWPFALLILLMTALQ